MRLIFLTIFAVLSLLDEPSPIVAVNVAAESQLATEDEAPVLPDDYSDKGNTVKAVTWELAQSKARLTLMTAMPVGKPGGWPCRACVQQKTELSKPGIDASLFDVLEVPSNEGNGLYPRWEDGNGEIIVTGFVIASDLIPMISKYGSAKDNTQAIATIEAPSSRDIASALVEHVQRHNAGGVPVSQGMLPTVPLDLPDDLLLILDGMLDCGATPVSGVKLKWPEGERSIVFSPCVEITLRKIVELDISVDKLTVRGRDITIGVVKPALCPDLTVRIK